MLKPILALALLVLPAAALPAPRPSVLQAAGARRHRRGTSPTAASRSPSPPAGAWTTPRAT